VTADVARARFAAARVARLATVAPDGRPHLVPITFALVDEDAIATIVDHKPKRTTALRRLANIAAHPAVAVLADHYSDEWAQLWWVRADGRARIIAADADPDSHARAVQALTARYAPYRERRPEGPVILVAVERWSGWSADEPRR
jgi:PPOX class probable F420-dependent enzyme